MCTASVYIMRRLREGERMEWDSGEGERERMGQRERGGERERERER